MSNRSRLSFFNKLPVHTDPFTPWHHAKYARSRVIKSSKIRSKKIIMQIIWKFWKWNQSHSSKTSSSLQHQNFPDWQSFLQDINRGHTPNSTWYQNDFLPWMQDQDLKISFWIWRIWTRTTKMIKAESKQCFNQEMYIKHYLSNSSWSHTIM